ncbi:hypothetical protein ACHAXR_011943 [Thalassiosira sp. AJA248-18]
MSSHLKMTAKDNEKGGGGGSGSGSGGKVIIVGSINQDMTTYAPTLPTPGQTILGTDFRTTPGGKGANQAVAASSIGVPVHMIGRVGNDIMGSSLLTSLTSRGVKLDEEESTVKDGHTGVASIVVDTSSGQNTIVVAPGANLELSAEDVESELNTLLKRSNNNNVGAPRRSNNDDKNSRRDVVLVQLEITPQTALQTLQTASAHNALTILNPAPAPKNYELTNEYYSSIDILIPNETELASLCGIPSNNSDGEEYIGITGEGEEAMAISLLERGVRDCVIVTLGARGAMIVRRRNRRSNNNEGVVETTTAVEEEEEEKAAAALSHDYNSPIHQTIMINEPPSLPCKSEPVIDAVGAGDAFCGALAAYLSRGIELELAASMACGVASISVRKRGAQESYPRLEDLPDCLRLDIHDDIVGTKSNGNKEEVSGGGEQKRRTITFVTGNKNKLAEVQRLLSSSTSSTTMMPDITNAKIDLPELQGSPQDIAIEKCKLASAKLSGTPVITEDTCLCFRALNDLPGPYIKWFLEDLGHDGLNKLLAGFDNGEDKDHTRAYAMTIIAYCPGNGEEVQLFEGRTEGHIVPARGSLDFGWDPIFEPTEDGQQRGEGETMKTYAEMSKDEKNAISHRGRAFRKFRDYLLEEDG